MLFLIIMNGCGNSDGKSTANPDSRWQSIVGDGNAELELRISAALSGIDEDSCFSQTTDVRNCSWDLYSAGHDFVDTTFLEEESVLIIDDLYPGVEILRNRNRILGYYDILPTGVIDEHLMQWDLPKVFGDIITGFATTPYIASKSLQPVANAVESTYGLYVPVFGSHGLVVYNILADLVPEQPIVLLDKNNLSFHRAMPEVFCSVVSDSEHDPGLVALREYSRKIANEIQKLINLHNIRYINASWGYTIKTIEQPWENHCSTPLPAETILLAILDAYQPVFEVLFNNQGVFCSHAAIHSPVDKYYPYDQKSSAYPNRLRVGHIASASLEIDEDGLAKLPSDIPIDPPIGDADIYINSGCDISGNCRTLGPLQITKIYGMDSVAFPITQSSFVNPVLLSQFIATRYSEEFRDYWLDNYAINLISNSIHECEDGTTACIFIDPLLHGVQ